MRARFEVGCVETGFTAVFTKGIGGLAQRLVVGELLSTAAQLHAERVMFKVE